MKYTTLQKDVFPTRSPNNSVVYFISSKSCEFVCNIAPFVIGNQFQSLYLFVNEWFFGSIGIHWRKQHHTG